jgi:hypothetical protein
MFDRFKADVLFMVTPDELFPLSPGVSQLRSPGKRVLPGLFFLFLLYNSQLPVQRGPVALRARAAHAAAVSCPREQQRQQER